MSSTPTTRPKKAGADVTMTRVLLMAVVNAVLGMAVAFCVLAGTAPQIYDPKPKKPGDKPPPPPSGIWYWEGKKAGGDWHGKEAEFLAAKPGSVSLSDSELNVWSSAIFKTVASAPKGAKPGTPAAPSEDSFKIVPASPNFRSAHPAEVPEGYLQIAVPYMVTVLGFDVPVVYQVRGHFVTGAQGPQFEPFYSSFGSARIPVEGGLAKLVFNQLLGPYGSAEALKKYAEVWPKLASATPGESELVLAIK